MFKLVITILCVLALVSLHYIERGLIDIANEVADLADKIADVKPEEDEEE